MFFGPSSYVLEMFLRLIFSSVMFLSGDAICTPLLLDMSQRGRRGYPSNIFTQEEPEFAFAAFSTSTC